MHISPFSLLRDFAMLQISCGWDIGWLAGNSNRCFFYMVTKIKISRSRSFTTQKSLGQSLARLSREPVCFTGLRLSLGTGSLLNDGNIIDQRWQWCTGVDTHFLLVLCDTFLPSAADGLLPQQALFIIYDLWSDHILGCIQNKRFINV